MSKRTGEKPLRGNSSGSNEDKTKDANNDDLPLAIQIFLWRQTRSYYSFCFYTVMLFCSFINMECFLRRNNFCIITISSLVKIKYLEYEY